MISLVSIGANVSRIGSDTRFYSPILATCSWMHSDTRFYSFYIDVICILNKKSNIKLIIKLHVCIMYNIRRDMIVHGELCCMVWCESCDYSLWWFLFAFPTLLLAMHEACLRYVCVYWCWGQVISMMLIMIVDGS